VRPSILHLDDVGPAVGLDGRGSPGLQLVGGDPLHLDVDAELGAELAGLPDEFGVGGGHEMNPLQQVYARA